MLNNIFHLLIGENQELISSGCCSYDSKSIHSNISPNPTK